MRITRRTLLQGTLGAASAYGLTRVVSADSDGSTESIVDTHVYIGHWPHRRLPGGDPTELVNVLGHQQIGRAWVGSFDGLFYKDIGGVNERLADACQRVGRGMLIPFGAVNPTLPDWEEDVRRCHETFRMPGIRLHPNYHGYTLADPRFPRLLELAAARGLVVQLVAGMEDERHFLLSPKLARVDLTPLAEKVAPLSKLKLVVANSRPMTDDEGKLNLLPLKSIHFDFARAESSKDVRVLIEKASADRVVFGSGMPLYDIDSIVVKIQQAKLTDGVRQEVTRKNAERLVASSRAR